MLADNARPSPRGEIDAAREAKSQPVAYDAEGAPPLVGQRRLIIAVSGRPVAKTSSVPALHSVHGFRVRVQEANPWIEAHSALRIVRFHACGSRTAGQGVLRRRSHGKRTRSARSGKTGSRPRRRSRGRDPPPWRSFCEKSAKLTPSPSHVAPKGYGAPGWAFFTVSCMSGPSRYAAIVPSSQPPRPRSQAAPQRLILFAGG